MSCAKYLLGFPAQKNIRRYFYVYSGWRWFSKSIL